MHHAAEEIVGYQEERRKEWISSDTWNLISLRKTLKQKINQTLSIDEKSRMKQKINQTLSIDEKSRITKEYSKIHKNIKKSARTDKRKWIDGIATAAEEAAATQNLKELYKSTTSKHSIQDTGIHSI
ncbi:hypothetical protein QE152_g6662 [Popillia japonica]|uniref:Uncharacterized protein n=1 Tax=Popillia japonica TaxID=7064 RepID=A0AAW1MI46_POPJA